MKKRILIFIDGYLPAKKYGGPVISISNLVENLGDEYEFYIVSNDHDYGETVRLNDIDDGWNILGKSKVLYLPDKEMKYRNFKDITEEINPSLLYVSSIFSARLIIPVFMLSRKYRISVILAPRGELNDTALCKNRIIKKAYLSFLKLFRLLSNVHLQATSDDEKRCIIDNLGVDIARVHLLPNIPMVTHNKSNTIKEQGLLKICFVGRILPNKNLLYAIKTVKKSNAEIILDIYGNIQDEDYWKQCENEIKDLPMNISINYKGVLDASEIDDLYGGYHLLFSPTLFENYGQAIAEAMLHDTPVLISQGTTPWDAVNDFNAGYSILLDDNAGFVKAIDELAALNNDDYNLLINRLKEYCSVVFDFDSLKKQYIDTMEGIIEKR